MFICDIYVTLKFCLKNKKNGLIQSFDLYMCIILKYPENFN